MQEQADLLLKPRQLFCPRYQKAVMICITPNCKGQHVLICQGDSCQVCETAHKDCKLLKIKPLVSQIIKKKQEISPIIQQAIQALENLYDNIIQRLSDDKMHVLDQIGLLGLSPHQIEFLRRINDGTIAQMRSWQAQQLFKKINQHNTWQADALEIKDFWKRQKIKFDTIFDQLKALPIRKSGKFNSKISHDLTCITGFFRGSLIRKAKLLYRASENDFSCQKFHNYCDNFKNILVLARTQHGKIIGGYTPIGFRIGNNWINDKRKQSFLFSVTNNQRFQLTKTGKSIFHGARNIGPVFGQGYDFSIGDKSSTQLTSQFNFGLSYFKGGKYGNRNQAIKAFTGVQKGGYSCLVTQWQVFTLEIVNV